MKPMKNLKKGKSGGASSSRVVAAPVSIGTRFQNRAPVVRATPGGGCHIRHTEFVGDVGGNPTFVCGKRGINPGNPVLFVWLSRIALNWEEYSFRRLVFRYEPVCSTATSGVVYMSVDPDPTDPLPVSKTELTSNKVMCRTNAWLACRLDVPVDDINRLLKFRMTSAGGLDNHPADGIRSIFAGAFIDGVQGGSPGTAFGEIYVDYEIELRSPQLEYSTQISVLACHAEALTASKTSPFGGSGTLSNRYGQSIDFGLTDTYYLYFALPGDYVVFVTIVGSGLTFGEIPTSSTSTVQHGSWWPLCIGPSSNSARTHVGIRVLSPGEFLTFGSGSLSGAITSSSILVAPYPYTFPN